MAIEIANFFEAGGVFDGFDPPVHPDNPIFTSNGVLPFDPATTPADPVGGFTRLATANYLVQLVRKIDFREAIVLVTCLPSKPGIGHVCATLLDPEPDESTDGQIIVLGDGVNDSRFSLGCFRVTTGFDGTESP